MRWGLLSLAAVTLAAAALRWFRIDAQSLWYDEGISAHQLTRSFAEIVRATQLDTHPPLYYWTLKVWGETFGASEVGLRSLSAMCGVATVVLTWLIGRRLFGTLAATCATLLLSVAPLAVYYSQEVRMYAQVTALGLLAVYAYTLRREPRRNATLADALYVAAAITTLYTQYLGAAFLIALNLHALLWRRIDVRWLAANAVVAIAFLPWLPTFIDQQSHALNVSPRTAAGLAWQTLTAYGGGIAHGDVFAWTGGALVVLALTTGGVMAAPRTVTPAAQSVTPAEQSVTPGVTRDATTLALLIWLVPLGLVLYLGLRSGLFEVRYLVLSLPGLCLLVGASIKTLTRYWPLSLLATAVLMVPAAQALQLQYFDPALARDDYRGLVQAIQSEAQPGDAILLSAPNQVEVFDYYYHGDLPIIGLPAQRPIDPYDTQARLDSIRQAHPRIWLVQWAMNEADPPGVINTWLADHGFQASHAWFGSVQLALIGLSSGDAATHELNIPMSNGLVLRGFRLPSSTLAPGGTLQLTLLWRAPNGPTAERWKVFTHILDQNTQVVAQRDAEPGDTLRPTTTWQAGEEVADNYGISVPRDLAAGDYTLEIGMYVGEKRAIFEGQGNHLVLGQIHVGRP